MYLWHLNRDEAVLGIMKVKVQKLLPDSIC